MAKTFPLLSLIHSDKRVQRLVEKDKGLLRLSDRWHHRVMDSSCGAVECYASRLKWTDEEIHIAGNELVGLLQQKKAMKVLAEQLRQRDHYPLYRELTDSALLRKAWMDAALGINRIFDVYISGVLPRYAKIDSISFKRGDSSFRNQVHLMIAGLAQRKRSLFYWSGMQAALDVLELNGRREAINYEPLQSGLNEEALLRIRKTDFTLYPYSVVLVPGLGPEIPGQALDPGGAKRCEEGAARYKKGLAPFIIVSGGNVHPFRTPFNEAVEMKKYLVEKLGIPSAAVLIEPHARHTTTNLRNASRMIYRFGFPCEKPLLIVTDASQAGYIAGRMSVTAERDLGYLPFARLRLLNEKEVEFYPVKYSLQPDPFDPLDP